jgi:predicted flap endonuclease-1-like 5' DNA nuclease
MNTERFFEGPGSSNMTTYIWEIAIVLLVAFVLGYLLRYLLNDSFKSRIANLESELNRLSSEGLTSSEVDATAEFNALQERIKEQATEIEKLSQKLAGSNIKKISLEKQLAGLTPDLVNTALSTTSNTVNIEPASTKEVVKDNLKKIEGIGPKIEELLNNDGVYSFQDLISASVSRIRGILIAAGPNYAVHDPSTWAEQARLAHEGLWDDLSDMQEQLKGGKRK